MHETTIKITPTRDFKHFMVAKTWVELGAGLAGGRLNSTLVFSPHEVFQNLDSDSDCSGKCCWPMQSPRIQIEITKAYVRDLP